MDENSIELCPICIENEAIYLTECNHKYCITCLNKIKSCALCRKKLLRPIICSKIRTKVKLIAPIFVSECETNSLTVDYIYLDINERREFVDRYHAIANQYYNNVVTNNSTENIDVYSFSLTPEEHEPTRLDFSILQR